MSEDGERTTRAVVFRVPAALGATTVAVVGEFNDWNADSDLLEPEEDGGFMCVVDVLIGRTYQYRYLIDGHRWENDWHADAYAPNAFGGDDSVLDLTDGSPRLAARDASEDGPAKASEAEPAVKKPGGRKRSSAKK